MVIIQNYSKLNQVSSKTKEFFKSQYDQRVNNNLQTAVDNAKLLTHQHLSEFHSKDEAIAYMFNSRRHGDLKNVDSSTYMKMISLVMSGEYKFASKVESFKPVISSESNPSSINTLDSIVNTKINQRPKVKSSSIKIQDKKSKSRNHIFTRSSFKDTSSYKKSSDDSFYDTKLGIQKSKQNLVDMTLKYTPYELSPTVPITSVFKLKSNSKQKNVVPFNSELKLENIVLNNDISAGTITLNSVDSKINSKKKGSTNWPWIAAIPVGLGTLYLMYKYLGPGLLRQYAAMRYRSLNQDDDTVDNPNDNMGHVITPLDDEKLANEFDVDIEVPENKSLNPRTREKLSLKKNRLRRKQFRF